MNVELEALAALISLAQRAPKFPAEAMWLQAFLEQLNTSLPAQPAQAADPPSGQPGTGPLPPLEVPAHNGKPARALSPDELQGLALHHPA